MGLVRQDNTVRLGLFIGLFLWLVMVVLALIGGAGGPLFSLSLIGAHVRLLLVIPLMFISETVLDPRQAAFAGGLVRRGIVQEHQLAELDRIVTRVGRLKDSWLLEVICLAAALFLSFGAKWMDGAGVSADFIPGEARGGGVWAAWWYWAVCLTVFRFLLMRALSRIILWTYFLWRVSRLDLRLFAVHPDCVAGLGNLMLAQMQYLPLLVGFAVLQVRAVCGGNQHRGDDFRGYLSRYRRPAAVRCQFFSPDRSWFSRQSSGGPGVNGLADYMAMAEDYVSASSTGNG